MSDLSEGLLGMANTKLTISTAVDLEKIALLAQDEKDWITAVCLLQNGKPILSQ